MFSDLESEFQCWQLIGIALNVVITKYAKQAKTKQNMVGFSQYYMGDNQWFYMVLFFTCICTLIVFLDKQVSLAPTLVRPSVRPSVRPEVLRWYFYILSASLSPHKALRQYCDGRHAGWHGGQSTNTGKKFQYMSRKKSGYCHNLWPTCSKPSV